MSVDAALDLNPTGTSRLAGWLRTATRYGLSTSGPVATSGAHFLASLIFVRALGAGQFGIFSFVLVIVPFCMSLAAAALVLPVTRSLGAAHDADPAILATCLKMNLLLTAVTMLAVFGFLSISHAAPLPAFVLALFGGILTYRWCVRCLAYVQGRMMTAVLSDLTYAGMLVAGLAKLAFAGHITLLSGAQIMLFAALAGLLPFGMNFFRQQWQAIFTGHLRDYRVIFRDLTRWSLLGVMLTEFTVNAHAYLVTFLSGPGPFALLALGALLMRPISLVQSALPDLERPAMTRAIAARDWIKLKRTMREFRIALVAVWLGAILLAATILFWFPQLLLKKGYPLPDVLLVTLLTAAIMMARNFRTPMATLMQAAGEFKALATIGTRTSIASIAITLALLLALGPIASLGGILIGELIILELLRRLIADWRMRHG